MGPSYSMSASAAPSMGLVQRSGQTLLVVSQALPMHFPPEPLHLPYSIAVQGTRLREQEPPAPANQTSAERHQVGKPFGVCEEGRERLLALLEGASKGRGRAAAPSGGNSGGAVKVESICA